MKPRIFISSVSRELKSARQLAANTLLALGYEPDFQDIFETSGDDLRAMLRGKIDRASAVLQIVGEAYGAEPPRPDERFGRVSYTQFEALYAQSKGKKVYYLIAGADFPRDAIADAIDIPRDESAAAQADAAERRALQEAYRAKIATAEHIYYPIASHSETELSVRRLRDELDRLRRGFRNWMVGVSIALALLVGIGLWLTRGQQQHGDQVAETKQLVERQTQDIQELKQFELKPERIREQIVRMVETTYKSAVVKADANTDWRKRNEAKEFAKEERDRALTRIDEFLNSIVDTVRSGEATPEYLEFSRIFQESGPEEALAYIATQQDRLLADTDSMLAQQQQELRQKLAPLLEAAETEASQGKYAESRVRCEKLLARAPDWPDALHRQFWNLTELGDRAVRFESVSTGEKLYQLAQDVAERHSSAREWSPQAQRDISVSHIKFGDVALQLGQAQAALKHYELGLEISRKLAEADPRDARAQHNLSVSYDKLGDVTLRLGQVQAALKHYELGLEIGRKLAEADPRDAQAQRDLVVSHFRIGKSHATLKNPDRARNEWNTALAILDQLIMSDQNIEQSMIQRKTIEKLIAALPSAESPTKSKE